MVKKFENNLENSINESIIAKRSLIALDKKIKSAIFMITQKLNRGGKRRKKLSVTNTMDEKAQAQKILERVLMS